MRNITEITEEEVNQFLKTLFPDSPKILNIDPREWYVDVVVNVEGLVSKICFYQNYVDMGALRETPYFSPSHFNRMEKYFYEAKRFTPKFNPFVEYFTP